MYVLETGEPTRPTIVLLHGGGVGGWSWRPEVERLGADYHLLVPDLPEQGRSLDDVPLTIPRAASLVADLIRERAGGTAHVAGLSLGGQTVVQLLADSPGVVDRALATGVNVHPVPGLGLMPVIGAMYMPFRNADRLVRANMKSLEIPEEYLAEFKEDTRALTSERFGRLMQANAGFRLPDGLGHVATPVLVTVGEREPKVVRASAHDLAAAIPSAETRLVEGVGHNWPLAEPELFTATLVAWIEGRPLPARLVALP
jgi:pimeloyl-ACP methyl ester carboxylesterase